MRYINVKTILNVNNELDFYRGCTHRCLYCSASSDLEVKENGLVLLEEALQRKGNGMIRLGCNSDPYQDIEGRIYFSRKALELIYKYDFGVCISTKSKLVLRDIDLIDEINKRKKAVVCVYVSSSTNETEPLVSRFLERMEILAECQKRNIPTVLVIEGIMPFINDGRKNIDDILKECSKYNVYGVICDNMGFSYNKKEELLEKLSSMNRTKYEIYYSHTNIYTSQDSEDLTYYFNALAKQYNILTDSVKIKEYMYNLDSNQLSIFDFI